MSYLSGLRLSFAGQFQAAPSTVNNDVRHFNNATFKPNYQQLGTKGHPNGWWNPTGGAEWRLYGCNVTGAWLGPDEAAPATDSIFTCLIADTNRRAPAKIVDLDPQQQLVSGVWGLEVRICDQDGNDLLRAQYEPASFKDLWPRATGRGQAGDMGLSSIYQSVLTDLEWFDISKSPFLQALKAAATDGLLSIKFNVDGYNTNFGTPNFTRGRIVGSIGVATAAEPRFFVPGRQLIPYGFQAFATDSSVSIAAPQIGPCVARVDEQDRRIYLDLGNALPTTQPGGPLLDQGTITLVADADNAQGTLPLGSFDGYQAPTWYEQTGGILVFPPDRPLTDAELAKVLTTRLQVQVAQASTAPDYANNVTTETLQGLYVRTDDYVFRIDSGNSAEARLYATQYGKPLAQTAVTLEYDASQLDPNGPPLGQAGQAMTFTPAVTTDANGTATLTIKVENLATPRDYIDGQLYGIRATVNGIGAPTPNEQNTIVVCPFGPDTFVSILGMSAFTADQPVSWYGSLQPIFQQYANLYPVMKRFLDLADVDAVWANRGLLQMAFGLPITDSNTMPVTRDLSTPKRTAILSWLAAPELVLGTAPSAFRATAAADMVEKAVPADAPTADDLAVASKKAMQGGKTAALSRRMGLVNH
ncbi:hypothetical protein E5K00_18905 [Hymenobacter aquaticus]|uniref:Uncharacterized protein n=1 Tax=Hymenobacter aquaticus TaxID=1867101 RepID=A0A4Z0PXY3_9BACT|nr:hypothetical protein [Hymenobacter aquaticus]TGE22315.1 hypothetical protein E5K00_18905 [Hymenobacter aquaticus]